MSDTSPTYLLFLTLFLLFISQWANLPLCRLVADGKDLADGKAILGRQPAHRRLFLEVVGKAILCRQLADDKEVADGKSFDSNSVGCRRRPWLPPPTKEALLNLRRRPYAALPPLSPPQIAATPPSLRRSSLLLRQRRHLPNCHRPYLSAAH